MTTFESMLLKMTEDGKEKLRKNNICSQIAFENIYNQEIKLLNLSQADEEIVANIAARLRMANYLQNKKKNNEFEIKSIITKKVLIKNGWNCNNKKLLFYENINNVLKQLKKYNCPDDDIKKILVKIITFRYAKHMYININQY